MSLLRATIFPIGTLALLINNAGNAVTIVQALLGGGAGKDTATSTPNVVKIDI